MQLWMKFQKNWMREIMIMNDNRLKRGAKGDENLNVNIGAKVKIEATVVDYNEGTKTMKLRIEGFQEDNHTPTERYIRMRYTDCEKNI